MRSALLAGLATAVAGLALFSPSPVSAADHAVFGIYAVWFEGDRDDDREEIDRFLECLVYGSNLNSYWHGEAGLELRGSWAIPPPATSIEWDEVYAYLTPHVESGLLPTAQAGETPLYLVFGGGPTLYVDACGKNSQASVAGLNAGVAIVRNFPLCWPTGDTLRTETQIAMHEIVETVDRVLGYGTCAGGGTCRGLGFCEDPCDTFVGLSCPGAPTATWTGCGGGQVEGWLVQKLGYEGRDPALCDMCTVCDFTPRACGDADPQCASVPPRSDPPNATPARGCSVHADDLGGDASGIFIGWVLILVQSARRRRSPR